MFRLSVLPALAVCAAGLVSAGPAAAQAAASASAPSTSANPTRVGIINLQKALLDTAELKRASADLQTKYKPKQDEIEKLQREIQDIQTQLQSSAGKLSQVGQDDLQASGDQKQRQVQRLTDELQTDVDQERNQILQRAQTRMYQIVKKIADEKNLDVIVDTTTVFFYKPALDITTEATAAYDKAYPLK